MPDQDKLTILFLAANPVDTAPLQLDEELRAIDQELRKTEFRDSFDLRSAWAVRYGDVQELLLRYKPHIVHFSGHGSSAGAIILQNAEGLSNQVSPDTLAALFGILKDNIRCVVLNACYSQFQAEGIATSIDCVVGMQRAVLDKSAIEFAAGFYLGLGFGRSVKTAFDLGCNRIGLAGETVAQRHLTTTPAALSTTADDTIPQLIALRTEPLQIVLVNAAVAAPPSSPAAVAKAEAVSLATMPPAEPDAKPPYQGLAYFDVADADRFFGREALTAQLVTYLKDHHFLVVVGASGSGKSSVVRAGVVTALKQGALQDSDKWTYHVITPAAHPLESLAIDLVPRGARKTVVTGLMDDMAADARSLHLHARQTVGQGEAGDRLLLVVDQFEELFTLCKDPSERKAFVDNLLAAASADGVTTVILTLRADFYAHCAQFDNLRLALAQHQNYIGAMDANELRDAIENPAAQGGWDLEPGLTNRLLKDVADQPGALPLLSHALLETWQRRSGRLLTLAAYEAVGGVQGAIAKTADAVYGALTPDEQTAARGIFLRLTTLGEGVQDTRRRVAETELASFPAVQIVLQKLENARLVTAGRPGEQVAFVEVTHEALIREWPRLREWLAEDREGLRLHRKLTAAAQEWDALGRDPGALYRGVQLQQARAWAAGHDDELNDLEWAFLAASEAQVEAERWEQERGAKEREAARQRELEQAQALAVEQQRRAEEQAQAARQLRERNRRFLIALVAAVVLAAVAGGFFLLAQSNAEQAVKAQATAQANADLANQLLEALKGEQFLTQARDYKTALDVTNAIPSFQAAAAYPKLGIDPGAEISDTLRFVATTWVEAGERLLRETSDLTFPLTVPYSPTVVIQPEYLKWAEAVAGQNADWLSTTPLFRQQAVISATALFSQALALNPPPDTLVYAWIAPGEFTMGAGDEDSVAVVDEKSQHAVQIDGYWIQRTEVTNEQYRRCVEAVDAGGAAVCTPPENFYWDRSQAKLLPVTNVKWEQGQRYAGWVGGRLPTEAEWEKGCRSTDGRIYPWGPDPPTSALANFGDYFNLETAAGSFPPGANGLYDMTGNVMEWTADWYDVNYDAAPPVANPTGPATGNARVVRGGAFDFIEYYLRCAARYWNGPYHDYGYLGFRVVLSPFSTSGR